MESFKMNVAAINKSQEVLPRYLELIRSCQKVVIRQFSELLDGLFEEMDGFMLQLAENAETNQQRAHYFEVMHDILLNQESIQGIFAEELAKGFDNFAAGRPEPLRAPILPTQRKLSLVDKDDYEVSLAYSETVRKANEKYTEYLLALNHRLAVLAGGAKLGEFHPGLPGSPAQACDAMQAALEFLDTDIETRLLIEWSGEFDRRVIQCAEDVYADYNRLLINGGILPNLSLEAIGFQPLGTVAALPRAESAIPPPFAAPPPNAPPADDDPETTPEHELFEGIRQLLAHRHGGPGPALAAASAAAPLPGGGSVSTDFTALMQSLNSLQANTAPISQIPFGQMSLESVKAGLAEQSALLANLVQQQQISTADADIIDLVGMLFEFILNDKSLPDSVKALLSHLHTPILKVAMIDRKFFFRNKHPARRLLNALTQAGALCNGDQGDTQGIFAKLRSVVERIVQEFEDNTQLFGEILDDFNGFVDRLGQRSEVMEKRAVESAKGRERLREARQAVSKELVDLTWDRDLPKLAESLIMGSWANLLVLIYLRNGKESPEWSDALKVVTDVVWSVQPKANAAERRKLREIIPHLEEKIRNGLNMLGDPEVNAKALFEELSAIHGDLLGREAEEDAATGLFPAGGEITLNVRPAPPDIQSDKAVWDDIDLPLPTMEAFSRHLPGDMAGYVEMLKSVKVGTWFEFSGSGAKARHRAKLSWFSGKTSYYIFVDQAGIQVAVKSMRALCHEMARGETRIVPMPKKPLVDRALEAVHSLLGQPEREALQ
jgi:hypothetical protein